VNFDSFPDFFLAHELAHQYWGQAVGWKSYHEQWISEGFAQYFAVLYAERSSSPGEFRDLIGAMQRSALQYSSRGPVFLGYRLGHLEEDSRVFRALVYNKGALVLHTLRRLLGDEAFFRALRTFYAEFRFRKAGTDDVRAVFEREAGRSLEPFFDQWIYGSGIPRVAFRHEVEPPGREGAGPAGAVRVRLEQAGTPTDLPLTVTLVYRSGAREDAVVVAAGAVSEHRLPLREPLRTVRVNDDRATLAIVDGS
jgi:aminopeptidase N